VEGNRFAADFTATENGIGKSLSATPYADATCSNHIAGRTNASQMTEGFLGTSDPFPGACP